MSIHEPDRAIETLVFDVRGPYGHFRKPYAPVSPVTFPFPPPTAVMGLIGAICGFPRDENATRTGWQTLQVGVRLLSPVRKMHAGINLLNTHSKSVDSYFRPRVDAHHMQIPFEFLVDPAFRIFIAGGSHDLLDELSRHLDAPRYQPVLGLANCLASVSLVTRTLARPLQQDHATLHSVVTLHPDESLHLDARPSQRVERFRVPAAMDDARVVHRYPEVMVATDATPLTVRGTRCWMLDGDEEAFTFI